MTDFKIVNPSELRSLEHYASSLLSGMASLKTLEAFHNHAFKTGLLDDDEQETVKTICWEIQRLLSLYQTQLKKIIERTGFNEQEAINHFRKLMPEIKIPRKRNPKSKDGAGRTQ